MFHGSIVALITPMHKGGEVERAAIAPLVEWQIGQGTQAIVAGGATGEGALLNAQEKQRVLQDIIQAAQGRIPVIASCCAPSTTETLTLVQQAQMLSAAAALIVVPYYIKPSQQGIYEHFRTIHEQSNLPLIIYNNPGRSVVDMEIDTVGRLAALPRIVGIKDSHRDISRVMALRRLVTRDFALLSGDDIYASAYLANGGNGCISITANVAPALCQQLMDAWASGDVVKFSQIRDQLYPLNQALIAETNPIPVKFAASELGYCHNQVRLPLLPASPHTREMVRKALANLPPISVARPSVR